MSVDKPREPRSIEHPELEEIWRHELQKALEKLPERDARWLTNPAHQKPFSSTEIMDVIQEYGEQHNNHPVQKFLARIDPIVSHVRSFVGVLNVFTNADPTGAGVIWGSMYLVLTVAGKTQSTLERVLDMLAELSPQLTLFHRWHQLYPSRSYSEVGESIKKAYASIIDFCVTAVRHLRRHPLLNVARTLLSTSMERDLKKHCTFIQKHTAGVQIEVDFAHKMFVQSQLLAISSAIDPAPTPRYSELPFIRIIPHSQNERFFGRQEILDRIRGKLRPSKRNSLPPLQPKQQRFSLFGFGGSGKTQIALEYTYRHLDDYKVIVWILADSPEKIDQGFGDAAGMMGLPKGTQSTSEVRAFVLHRLSTSGEPYLLCFDNADDLSLITNCFPRDTMGSILVTSRDSLTTADVVGDGMTVPEFSISEGCAFLSSLLDDVDDTNPEIKATLEEISTTFQGYPLALAQAAAFIRNGGCHVAEFLDIFRTQRHSNAISSLPMGDYHATLFTVWDLSFRSLSERSRQVLEILVYLDPDSVPNELLAKGCVTKQEDAVSVEMSELGYMANPVDLWTALKGLRSHSLIRTNAKLKTISIHRFLQEQAFRHLCSGPSRQYDAFERSLFLLSNFQPEFPNVTQHWSPTLFRDSELCLAHIKRLAARFLDSPSMFAGLENKLGRLIFESASYQFERFHHEAATESFALARRVICSASQPHELYLSDCYRMEGRMFNESGQPTQGAESNRQARKYALKAIAKGYIRRDDQRMPRILTGLGNSLSQLREFDSALKAQLEAKRLCGDVPPEQSDAITIIQLNLGFLLYHRDELKSAEQILRATLEANPRTPPAMYALGNTLLAQGSIEEAIAVHLKGHEIYVDMFGDQHALVGRCAYKVGEILLLHKQDPRLARTYIRRAMKIYRKQESPYYTVKAYARAARMLAKTLELEGRADDARRYYEEAWKLREKIDGIHGSPNDKDTDYSSPMFYWDR